MPYKPPSHKPIPDHIAQQQRRAQERARRRRRVIEEDVGFYQRAAWRKFRAAFLATHPVCAECQRESATQVDHIKSRVEYPHLALDESNCRAVCLSCHSRATAKYDGGFGRPRQARPEGEGGTPG